MSKIHSIRQYPYIQKAYKGKWWMPWVIEAMKDVLDCDKLWGAVKKL